MMVWLCLASQKIFAHLLLVSTGVIWCDRLIIALHRARSRPIAPSRAARSFNFLINSLVYIVAMKLLAGDRDGAKQSQTGNRATKRA